MENAAKALYIAASILVGMMILGVFVYLFRAGGSIGENYEQKQNQQQLQLFNSKFENFDKSNNTIIDMITVTNLAIDNNKENEYNGFMTVAIDIIISGQQLRVSEIERLERNYLFKGDTGTNKIYIYDLIDKNRVYLHDKFGISLFTVLENNEDTLSTVNNKMVYKYLFKCTNIEYHKSTGRVKYMKFNLIKNEEYN